MLLLVLLLPVACSEALPPVRSYSASLSLLVATASASKAQAVFTERARALAGEDRCEASGITTSSTVPISPPPEDPEKAPPSLTTVSGVLSCTTPPAPRGDAP